MYLHRYTQIGLIGLICLGSVYFVHNNAKYSLMINHCFTNPFGCQNFLTTAISSPGVNLLLGGMFVEEIKNCEYNGFSRFHLCEEEGREIRCCKINSISCVWPKGSAFIGYWWHWVGRERATWVYGKWICSTSHQE